jgi:short-subunit dehydrogenase
MKRTLTDMVAIITGASSGIGRALAVELSARGAKLVLSARRTDRLEALNEELMSRAQGDSVSRHLCIPADVSSREQCEMLIDKSVERFGRIDTLVCNAGYGMLRPVAETTSEQALAIFQTNLFGTLDCIRRAVPVMQKQQIVGGYRGQIMLVSSAVARRSIPFFGLYSATKAAQLSIGESLRVELFPRQIAVTTVHPAGTSTEFGDVSATQSDGRRPKRIPGEIVQTATDVAKAMLRAIESPRPEVWPNSTYRWLISLGTMFPGMIDRLMLRRSDQIGGTREAELK